MEEDPKTEMKLEGCSLNRAMWWGGLRVSVLESQAADSCLEPRLHDLRQVASPVSASVSFPLERY